MNREAFRDLLLVLEDVEKNQKRFDLSDWTKDPDDCNSAACAIGWAARSKLFQDRGLTVEGGLLDLEIGDEYFYDWDAVHMLFDIEDWYAYDLFCPDSYPNGGTVSEVIKKIKTFIRETP